MVMMAIIMLVMKAGRLIESSVRFTYKFFALLAR